jgi:Tfp pilus assembly protein PilN
MKQIFPLVQNVLSEILDSSEGNSLVSILNLQKEIADLKGEIKDLPGLQIEEEKLMETKRKYEEKLEKKIIQTRKIGKLLEKAF